MVDDFDWKLQNLSVYSIVVSVFFWLFLKNGKKRTHTAHTLNLGLRKAILGIFEMFNNLFR